MPVKYPCNSKTSLYKHCCLWHVSIFSFHQVMLLCCWGCQLGTIVNMCMWEPAFVRKPLFILPNCHKRASTRAHLDACLHEYQSLPTPVYVKKPHWLSWRLAPVRDRLKTPLVLERWDLFSVLVCQHVVFTPGLLNTSIAMENSKIKNIEILYKYRF